jgi:hypothetical protein
MVISKRSVYVVPSYDNIQMLGKIHFQELQSIDTLERNAILNACSFKNMYV